MLEDAIVAAEHVHRVDVLVLQGVEPAQQGSVDAAVQRIDQQAGQEEVIDDVAFPGYFLVQARAVLRMDFR